MLSLKPECIKDIRFGVNISAEFKNGVIQAMQSLPHRPKAIQMGCDYKTFTLTETEISPN